MQARCQPASPASARAPGRVVRVDGGLGAFGGGAPGRPRPRARVRKRTLVGHVSPQKLHSTVRRGRRKRKQRGSPFEEAPPLFSVDGGAENRTRVQRPTPVESTC